MDLQQRGMSVFVPNLAILLFVASGLVTNDAPLESIRPFAPATSMVTSHRVFARLWQDPLSTATLGKLESIESGLPDTQTGVSTLYHPLDRSIRGAQTAKTAAWAERNGTSADGEPISGSNARVLILGVLLTGGPYPEDGEVRLRTRYAVLSALGRAQYVSRDRERLRVLRVADEDNPGRNPLVVPCEEFDVRYLVADGVDFHGHENNWRRAKVDGHEAELEFETPFDRIIVLWLNETELSRRGRRSSAEKAAAVVPQRITKLCDQLVSSELREACTLRILGPSSTDDLVDFVARGQPPGAWSADVYCSRATAADPILKISSTRSADFSDPDLFTPASVGAPSWNLHRTTATDDRLIDELNRELGRRGVKPGKRNHVVLIGEWDTLYSRGLGRTFAAKLLDGAPIQQGSDERWSATNRDTWSTKPEFFHEFSYLRGLDGLLPQAETNNASEEDSGLLDGGSLKDKQRERAAGPSQTDYLRRMEHQLITLRNELRRSGRGEIAAIGVVGSDVYDKLLVLRALRRSFNRTIFFTTDMDALYVDPSERTWARNLVIVSPFGLSAVSELQGRIPPFRDSYQTALFLTTLKALGLDWFTTQESGRTKFDLAPGTIAPRIFEVGRSGAHELTVEQRAEGIVPVQPAPAARYFGKWNVYYASIFVILALVVFLLWQGWRITWVRGTTGRRVVVTPPELRVRRRTIEVCHNILWLLALSGIVTQTSLLQDPEQAGKPLGWRVMLVFLGVLVVCGFSYYQMRSYVMARWGGRPLAPDAAPPNRFVLVLGCALLGASLCCLTWAIVRAATTAEEPFFWFEGISIWPTELMRFSAILLGAWFLVLVRSQLGELARLGDAIEEGRIKPRTGSRWGAGSGVRTIVQGIQHAFQKCVGTGKTHRESELWKTFQDSLRFEHYFPRVFLHMLVYLAAAIVIGAIFGQAWVPGRGIASFSLDRGILASAVVVHVFLLFYVFDATLQCARLVRQLTKIMESRKEITLEFDPLDRITELTAGASRFVYYPFSILFILIVSRNSLFDSWDWPISLIAILGSGFLLLIGCTVALQQRAREARRVAADIVDSQILTLLGSIKVLSGEAAAERSKSEPDEQAVARIDAKIDHHRAEMEWIQERKRRIDALDGVVFQAWYKNPLFRAALIPIGGLGSLTALEQMVARVSS